MVFSTYFIPLLRSHKMNLCHPIHIEDKLKWNKFRVTIVYTISSCVIWKWNKKISVYLFGLSIANPQQQ